jgi:hypothetical protein
MRLMTCWNDKGVIPAYSPSVPFFISGHLGHRRFPLQRQDLQLLYSAPDKLSELIRIQSALDRGNVARDELGTHSSSAITNQHGQDQGVMQLISLSSGGDSAVAQLQTQETTRPGGSAAHQSDFTPEIPLARALEKMHCLKDRQDHVMIDQQLSSSYLIEVYKKAPLPTSEEPNFLVLYSQFPSQAL